MTRVFPRRPLAGFTLIELLVVIVIIGILVAIGVPAYLKYTAAANDRDAQAALQVAYKAAVAGDTEVNNSRFPVATTVVNDVKADEPAAAIARGDCAGTVVQAPVKQVLVDPASTSSSVTFCTRSASGTIWKLTGPLTGTPTLADGSSVALTSFTGNEITDTLRAAATQGDGLAADSSTGLWEGTTNLLKNGGCEGAGTPNLGPWGGTNNETRARDTSQHKFGAASCVIGTDGTAINQGVSWHDDANLPSGRVIVSPGTVYTFSVWLRGSVGGETVKLGMNSYDAGSTNLSNTAGSTVTLTTSWQRAVYTTTTPASTANVWVWVETASMQAATFYVDGAQLEAKSEATPYVETNGAQASRALTQLQAPASLLSPTQGWVAVRLRLGFSNTDVMNPTAMAIFDIGSNNNNEILGYWDPTNHLWSLGRDQGVPSSPGRPSAGDAFAPGTTRTVVFRWTASQLAVSVNGAAFVNGGVNAALPTLDTNLYIGSRSWGSFDQQPDSDILWLATGTGTLSDADAATINGWGSSDPKRASFPASAQATMAWDGTSAAGSLK